MSLFLSALSIFSLESLMGIPLEYLEVADAAPHTPAPSTIGTLLSDFEFMQKVTIVQQTL